MTETEQDHEMSPGETAPVSDAGASGGASKPPRRKAIWFVLAGLAIVATILGVPYYLHSISHESTDDAFIDGDIIAVSPRVAGHVAQVHVTDNQWVKSGDLLVELDPRDFQARLDAALAVLEAAKAADRARNVEVEMTTITSNAGLSEAKANVEAARAGVEAARAQAAAAASQRDQAKAQVALAAAALDEAKAEIDSAEAKHQRDFMDLKRYREMTKTRAVSEHDLDHAEADELMSSADLRAAKLKSETQKSMVQQAEAALRASEDNLRHAKAQLEVCLAQLDQMNARLAAAQSAPMQVEQIRSQADQSNADIQKAKAELAQARLNLSYTRIYAPTDGFVTKKGVEAGAFVQVGQALLAIVPTKVWVTANFKETQLDRMRPGQPVKIEVDAYPGMVFHGHVDSIQRGTGSRFSLLPPENATGNFVKVVQRVPVKIVFDGTEDLHDVVLAPGMSVVPEVEVAAAGQERAGKSGQSKDVSIRTKKADAEQL